MIKILQVLNNKEEVQFFNDVEQLAQEDSKWYWVDFSQPTEEETELLASKFGFNQRAVEDCRSGYLTPKMDSYSDYRFFVIQWVPDHRAILYDINLFVGKNFIVSYHKEANPLLDRIMGELRTNLKKANKGVDFLFYHIISQIVDQYFPVFFEIGDEMERLEEVREAYMNRHITEDIFLIRKTLLTLRRSLVPFQEVVTQIMHPDEPEWETAYVTFFADVSDHISRLVEMTEFYREMGSDLIESVNSLSSQSVNHVILVLTVITTIFMPLTFIVGIYGMNFDFMPELRWKFGYPMVLAFMGGISAAMVIWFRKRGWL